MAIQGFNWSTRLRWSECILLLEYQLKIIMAGFVMLVLFLSFLSFCLTEVKCILLLDYTLFHPSAASLQTAKNTVESPSYDDNKAADGQNYSQLTNSVGFRWLHPGWYWPEGNPTFAISQLRACPCCIPVITVELVVVPILEVITVESLYSDTNSKSGNTS